MSLWGGRPFRMSGGCPVALPDVREAVPVFREWSGYPLGCSGVFGRPSRMFGCGQEAFPDVRNWSGGPSG